MLGLTGTVLGYYTHCERPIMLREMMIKDATFEETVACLRIRTRIEDTFERDPNKKGVNFVIKDPRGVIDKTRRVSIEIHDVKLEDAVKVIAALYGVRGKAEPYAVVFSPKSDDGGAFVRTFKVPPDFPRMRGALK